VKGSIVKKGNTYFCVYRINGKQKWVKGGPTKRQAEKLLTEILNDVNQGTYRKLKEIGFTDYARLWLDSYATIKLKPSTLRSYQDIISGHLIPYFDNAKLTSISPAMIQNYIPKKLEEGLKPKTVNNHLVPLKEMLKHAVIWGYLKQNPAIYVEKPRIEKEEMEFLTLDEVRAFLNEVTPKYYVLFLTAIETGLRRGELLGIQKGDIGWHSNQIHVRRAIWKGRFVTPKSNHSIRNVDISPNLVHELKKHILSTPHSDMDLVFCNKEGKPLDPDSLIKRHFLPALRRAGIRKIPFHSLRHTNIALRIAAGQNIYYIQKQVGHASIQTTLDKYGHLLAETKKEAAQKLHSLLGFENSKEESVRRMLENPTKKGLATSANPLKSLVAGPGFEPGTFGL